MSFTKRSDSDAVCYTKPLDSLKCWNDHFFWVNSFACPAFFPWHTGKNVSRDPFPKSTEFNADDYVILVAHLAMFWKFMNPFLCLVGMSHYYTLDEDTYPKMDLSAFIHVADPTKVKVADRERVEEEARLLDSTVGCVVSLLPVTLARTKSDLEASIDRLFDEGGSADQGDFAVGGGQDVETELVTGVKIIAAKNMIAEKPKRTRRKRQAVTDASGSSHPPKKWETTELLANVEAVATLPLVTSSVSVTPEHESGSLADSITGLNLRIIDSSKRSVAPPLVMTGAVITTNIASIPTALAPKIGTKVICLVYASMFHDSDSTRTVRPDAGGSSHIPGKELSIGSWEINSETLHEMDYHYLFTEFNVGTARQACLNAEVRMRTEYYLSERKRLEFKYEKQADFLKDIDVEVSTAKATEKILADEIDALKQRNVSLENEKDSLDGKLNAETLHQVFVPQWNVLNDSLLDDSAALFSQIREMDYHHLFTEFNVGTARQACLNAEVRMRTEYSLSERKRLESEYEKQAGLLKARDDEVENLKARLLLKETKAAKAARLCAQVHALDTTCSSLCDQFSGYKRLKEQIEEFQDAQMKIEYLTDLGFAISRAFEKGMQSGLSAGIDHGKAGRNLADVVAYNPAAEADYNSALQRASSASVAHSRVKRIRENVAAQRSSLLTFGYYWLTIYLPQSLIGAASTSSSVAAAVVSTTALSTTFASASSVSPITTDDYEIVNVDGQEDAQGNVASFPTVEFEKEELNTTLERDPPS
ncbi:hypothetical protein Tco_0791911 [Tanacetum coccineum]